MNSIEQTYFWVLTKDAPVNSYLGRAVLGNDRGAKRLTSRIELLFRILGQPYEHVVELRR